MDIRISRWALRHADGAEQPILRLLQGDAPLSDPDYADYFVAPIAAAEAAARLSGVGSVDGKSWLNLATEALVQRVDATLNVTGSPIPRPLSFAAVQGDVARWLVDAGSPLTDRSSEQWELSSLSGATPKGLDGFQALDIEPLEGGEDLSGNETGAWAFVELAGVTAGGHHTLPTAEKDELAEEADLLEDWTGAARPPSKE